MQATIKQLAQSPAVHAAAKRMIEDSTDYFPHLRNGAVIGDTAGLPVDMALFAFDDGIWLVKWHEADVSMNDAEKLVLVLDNK